MSLKASRDVFSFDTDPFLYAKYPSLSTKDALSSLYYDILNFKNETCNKARNKDVCSKIIWHSFHHSSYFSTFSWIPVCVLIVITTALIWFTSSNFIVMYIIVLTILNILINYWDNYSRYHEFENRINYILQSLKKTQKANNWKPEQFPNLYTPHSPSVSLQWTIRDGQVVNLPSILLAKGDIIIMRPGHVAPADLETILPPPSQDNKYNVLITDQLLNCDLTSPTIDVIQSERVRSVERPPIADRLYEVTKAPYISQLKAINNKYLEKPTSLYDKARYLLFGKCLHHVLLPFCFILCELLASLRWYIFQLLHCQHYTETERWIYFFISETVSVLLPLISLAFPVFWFISNAIGNATLLSRFSAEENNEEDDDEDDKEGKNDVEMKKTSNSYYADIEESPQNYAKTKEKIQKNKFFRYLMKFIRNNGYAIVRSTNFLHTMASVTVLCCVDKKGVLSFPNPIAEKVFFLKNVMSKNEIKNDATRTVAYEDSNYDEDACKLIEDSQNKKAPKLITPSVEILDITPRDEKGSAWKIEFDDSLWRHHLSSLKPIGLAILLNTCNRETHKSYNHFCAHITSHALQNKHLIPVTNRRCLCELARQIGFQKNSEAVQYSLELQLFTYKSLAGNKYVQALFKTRKPQFPFPHAMSVIVSNNQRNNKSRKNDERKRKRSDREFTDSQMFSQGTADVILDYCIDYWDGYDVHPLTPAIRKKILDFYQRSSLTAYCTAFSYRPVYKNLKYVANNSSAAVYLELLKNLDTGRQRRRQQRPKYDSLSDKDAESQNEYLNVIKESYQIKQFSGSNVLQNVVECNEELDDIYDYDEYINPSIDEYENLTEFDEYSEESEDDAEQYEDCDTDEFFSEKLEDTQRNEWNKSRNLNVNYFQVLGKQIFLGMVSMQYQPLLDMVQMIEELEKACIRFVHFSKENELRSRVFSEKMGLESGWNCHISLLHENDTAQVIEGFGKNEGVFIGTDLDISSNIETGASSADDEENIPFTFDISNRAKLPCGIRNIRPHLEQVDNVPLLVSLFTDCTAETTEQMLTIMQEYGQVVCVFGSSANIKNFPLFARADVSISVEPLYAQVCQQIPLLSTDERVDKTSNNLSPTELSELLNSLPCSLILQRNYNFQRVLPFYPLIADARNLMRLIWNCCQYWLCCTALILALQILSLLLLLPAIFNIEQSLWLSVVIIPCFSISLVAAPHDIAIMNKTKGKDWLCSVNWTTITYAMTCYGSKLLCGAVNILTFYVIQLMAVCDCMSSRYTSHWNGLNSTAPTTMRNPKHCVYVFILVDVDDDKIEFEYINTLDIIQYHMALILSLNLGKVNVISTHEDSFSSYFEVLLKSLQFWRITVIK